MTRWSRRRKRYPPPRFTTGGWWYIGVTTLTGLAAYHSGNNVLFLAMALFLSSIIISGLISWWSLSWIGFRAFRGQESRSREVSALFFEFRDRKRLMPSLGLVAIIEVKSPDGRVTILKHSIPPRVQRGRWETVRIPWESRQRGLHHMSFLRVESLFPFGFIVKSYPLLLGCQVLVWPRKVWVSTRMASVLESGPGTRAVPLKVGDLIEELSGLRPYRPGDPLRLIHWRKTAQLSQPLVKVGTKTQRDSGLWVFDFGTHHFRDEEAVEVYCGWVGSLTEMMVDRGRDLRVALHNGSAHALRNRRDWAFLMDKLAVLVPFADELQPHPGGRMLRTFNPESMSGGGGL